MCFSVINSGSYLIFIYFIVNISPLFKNSYYNIHSMSYLSHYGADEENRTPVTSLEGWSSTTKLHPHAR